MNLISPKDNKLYDWVERELNYQCNRLKYNLDTLEYDMNMGGFIHIFPEYGKDHRIKLLFEEFTNEINIIYSKLLDEYTIPETHFRKDPLILDIRSKFLLLAYVFDYIVSDIIRFNKKIDKDYEALTELFTNNLTELFTSNKEE